MKRALFYFTMFMAVTLLAVSCDPVEQTFDETLLYGKWQAGTLFYKYASDGSGYTWDSSEVLESEAQDFTWTLVNSELTQNHIMEMGGIVPKVYTVTELTATTLKYEDDFGVSSSFTKVTK